MKNYQKKLADRSKSRGGVLVLVALLLVVFVSIAALAIDIGYLTTTRNELQNVADAAALAGAGYLGSTYYNLPSAQQGTHVFARSEIVDVVQEIAGVNRAAKVSISVIDDSNNIRIGLWDQSTANIGTQTLQGPDAVYVKVHRDGQANSPITTFFAGIFGVDTMAVTAEATAALSGPSTVAEGEMITPFGLSERLFPNSCTDLIEFSPTTESCAAWHNFLDPINANAMAEKLIGFIQEDTGCRHAGGGGCGGLLNGPTWLENNFDINKEPDAEVTPSVSVPVDFEFQGGTIASLFLGGYLDADYNSVTNPDGYNGNTGPVFDNDKKPAPMLALFDYFRYRDGDGDDTVWSATIPVYKDNENSCMNANNDVEIVGFARIKVFFPNPPPSNNIQVLVDCNLVVVEGRGGGGFFGNIKGTIPNLVK